MLKPLTEKPGKALAAGSFTVAAIGAAATLALGLLGGHAPAGRQAAQDAPAAARTADWKPGTAATVLAGALEHAPGGWSPTAATQQLATPPLPYSCPLPGAAASTSLSRDYTAAGTSFRVTVQAYTAGLGAEALARQEANAPGCASDGGTTLWDLSGDRPGVESKAASSVRAGNRTAVVAFRRGDVVVYVSGAAGAPLQPLAKAFDDGLAPRLAPVCLHEDSTAADASRSPFSSTGYRAYTVAAKATIPDVPLPSTTAASTAASASPALAASPTTAASAAAVVPVPIPAPTLVDREAEPMGRPAGHAVSPAMPDPVALPVAPGAPAAKAVTEATVQVPSEDADGPGCGWAFTGMKPVPFDRDAAQRTTADLLAAARTKLAADATAWQASVLAYWTGYAAYAKDAAAYNAYRDQVDSVNKSWTAIGAKWDAYDQAQQAYEQKVKDRQDFIDRQDAARKDFDAQTAACAAPVPSPTATPSPSPTASASPSATASPSPSATSAPRPGCPPVRPSILDQAAPQLPDAPTKPADPAG